MTLTITPAEAEDAPQSEPADGRISVTVLLQPRHYEYLAERAALHGETPERHLETILRTFRSHHDTARPTGGGTERRRA